MCHLYDHGEALQFHYAEKWKPSFSLPESLVDKLKYWTYFIKLSKVRETFIKGTKMKYELLFTSVHDHNLNGCSFWKLAALLTSVDCVWLMKICAKIGWSVINLLHCFTRSLGSFKPLHRSFCGHVQSVVFHHPWLKSRMECSVARCYSSMKLSLPFLLLKQTEPRDS